jgi:hypothetical protein
MKLRVRHDNFVTPCWPARHSTPNFLDRCMYNYLSSCTWTSSEK